MQQKILSIILLQLCLSSCSFHSVGEKHKAKTYPSLSVNKDGYHFKWPDITLTLPLTLSEISGLSYNPSNNTLLAVNDEQGLLYEIEPSSGKVLGKEKFGPSGDYEGIEKVDNNNFIINSSGILYRFSNEETESIHTPLSSKNDVEGLSYDVMNKELLIACKAKSLNNDPKGTKGIYAYSIEDKVFKKEPYLLLRIKGIKKFIKKNGGGDKALKRADDFSPSGIAIHPFTRNLYLLSARESMMLIFSQEHKLIECVLLDKDKIPQPEGICFDSKGNLFISTEGQGRNGKIFIYKPTP
ncbi:SdiA-regulated domain-containing protein [Saccharicrinis fermentans]|uniref:Gluconolactonase n=1 Tax=Saccharicrinis fermentans DSM 9555 = JCM 21142 TaxID=869213 RepID=W7Y0K0_9BACT|nr:SdiA-regulated domain-containing protein [Saccharicrinis fermentans]GAF04440.1 hypothetical protein JCM21142_83146 [Saccharicrinis fermentans DSM 9555 = JCM 21142]